MNTPDLRDDKSLPAAVLPLLESGRGVIERENRERELREEAAAGAKRAIIATNIATASAAIVSLCPAIARLMEFAQPVESDDLARVPPEFLGLQFELNIPGFFQVRVWVSRKRTVVNDTPPRHEWSPWELGEFCVAIAPNMTAIPYPSLALALAHARERWLKHNGQ